MTRKLLLIVLAAFGPFSGAQTLPQSKIVYLSSLAPIGTPVNGHGPFEKDMSNGESAAGDGNLLKIGRVPYTRGLGVHPSSDLTFPLNKRYATFSAVVGIDDELLTNGCAPMFPGSAVFQVFVDDVKVFDSGTLSVWSPAKPVSVDVTGKTALRLAVNDGGDGNVCDHSDWADAKLSEVQ